MDSAKESFTISSQETLLLSNDHQQPFFPSKKTRIKNLKTKIFFGLLILVILIVGSIILSSIYNKKRKAKQLEELHLSSSSRYYYCHLTPHPDLCYTSISSIINTTVLKYSPDLIFTTALQLAINELNNSTISITKALSSSAANSPVVKPRLSMCQTLVHDSLSCLNKSLGLFEVDSDIESLTYVEMDNFRGWTIAATNNTGKCFMALEEIGDMMMMVGGEDEKMRVEEVKLGVEKANKLIVNSIWLFDRREFILFDFYNPSIEVVDSNYDYYYYDNYGYYFYNILDYRFLVCFYSAMYLFIALLYFLFWRSN